MHVRISIITVCYNAATTIASTLRSVTAQTYPHIEHIVIDGASTDSTLELVKQLAPTAQLYSEPDRGIYDAMNKGLDRATGDYLWYMNAGDALPSADTVERLVAATCATQLPDIIYGDTRLVDSEGRDLGLRRLRPPRELNWRSFERGMLVCHQAILVKRSLAPKYDLRYRFSADVDWCIRAMKEARDLTFYPQVIACYLSEGTTTANHRASLLERFDIMRRHYGLVRTLLRHLSFLLLRQR